MSVGTTAPPNGAANGNASNGTGGNGAKPSPQTALSPQQMQFINLRKFFESKAVQDQLRMALPKHVTSDRMTRVLLTAMSKQPKLLECSRESLILSLMQASELGLEPNGYDAHIIPYNNKKKINGRVEWVMEAQFQTDYKGLVKLAYQSGMVQSVTAIAVYEADEFRYKLGTNEFLDHVPADLSDRGPLVFAWAMVKLENGGTPFVVLNRAEVMAHRDRSKGKDSDFSPWNDPATEPSMWAKTAFRVLSKFIPRSPELQRALAMEDSSELPALGNSLGGVNVPAQDAPVMLMDRSSQSDDLADALQQRMMGGQQMQEQEAVPVATSQPQTNQQQHRETDFDASAFEASWIARVNVCTDPAALNTLTGEANGIADDGIRVRVHERIAARRKEIAAFKGSGKRQPGT